eukprot:768679-Hanusia_phi.AAC.3
MSKHVAESWESHKIAERVYPTEQTSQECLKTRDKVDGQDDSQELSSAEENVRDEHPEDCCETELTTLVMPENCRATRAPERGRRTRHSFHNKSGSVT